jgi:hypothetical protein
LQVRALLDTGASQSALDLQCVSALGLVSAASTTMHTPTPTGITHTFDIYNVSITLLHPEVNFTLGNQRVVGAALAVQGFEVLLGRDVLRNCFLAYNGPADTFTLAF